MKILNLILRLESKGQPQNINNFGTLEITFVDDNWPLRMYAPSHQKSAMEVNSNNSKEQNPLNIHWLPSSETIYVPHLVYELSNESALAITAGENKTSLTMILNDCQVSSYPHLFSTERFDYTFNRSISLSPLKNFNQRLLNYTQVFASDND